MTRKPLIIIGDSAFAEVAYEYFMQDSPYEVVAFAVEAAYHQRDLLMGKPVVILETLEQSYPANHHAFYAAIVYTQLNRLRTRLYDNLKARGYTPASYISPHARVWSNAILGEHCFIFEENVIQPFVQIGNNVVLWSGNHIGHHSQLGDHSFLASHVVISGFVNIGSSCFFGVNSTVANNVNVAEDCLIGAGATVVQDLPPDSVVRPANCELAKVGARRFSRIQAAG